MAIINSQVNVNRRYVIQLSGSSYITASVGDNFNVSKPIPGSDFGYTWITASAELSLTPQISLPSGYATAPDSISFVSSSEFRVDGVKYHTTIFPSYLHKVADPGSFTPGTTRTVVNLNTYTVTLDSQATAENTRIYLSRNIGNSNYPSWKQVRPAYNPVYLSLKRSSNLVVLDPSPVTYNGNTQIRERLGSTQTRYNVPYMTSKFRQLRHGYEEVKKFNNTEFATPINLLYDYSNLLAYFPIQQIDNKLNVTEKESLVYTSLYDKYVGGIETNVGDFRVLKYSEVVWPKEENTFLGKIRNRPNFQFNWRENRTDRTEYSASNSQNHVIPTSSMWPLDARPGPYRTETLFTTASSYHKGDVGELSSVSSIYHNGSVDILTASALFSYPMPDSSSAGVFFTNDTAFRICIPSEELELDASITMLSFSNDPTGSVT